MIKMKYYGAGLLLLFFGLLACKQNPQADNWKQLDLKLKTLFELPNTNNSEKEAEIYINFPGYVVTNSKGEIIVADTFLSLNKLIVFDKRGEFLYTIGKPGPGPAEFRRINGMGINSSDEILVYDQGFQTIKKFASAGNYITSYSLKEPVIRVMFEFWHDNPFLFYLKEIPNSTKPTYLVHAYSPTFNTLIGEFIPFKKLKSYDEDLRIAYVTAQGNDHFIDNNTLYFTTPLYNGLVYQYEISRDKDQQISLHLKKKTKGHIFMQTPAERFNGERLSYPDATVSMAGGRKYQYVLYNQSRGLFRLSNGLIVHFTYIEKEKPHKRIFGVEVYDKDMNPIGYAPIRETLYNSDPPKRIAWKIAWKDEQDRFYVVDNNSNRQATIHVMELEGIDKL